MKSYKMPVPKELKLVLPDVDYILIEPELHERKFRMGNVWFYSNGNCSDIGLSQNKEVYVKLAEMLEGLEGQFQEFIEDQIKPKVDMRELMKEMCEPDRPIGYSDYDYDRWRQEQGA